MTDDPALPLRFATRNALAGSVQVGGNPGSLAVDTDTHRVYVINTKDRTVEVLGR